MSLAAPPVRGVIEVPASRIVELILDGALPRLHDRLMLDGHDADAPTAADAEGLRWYLAGRAYAPSAVMGLRPRYAFWAMRRVIEIEHIAGSKWGVVRLLCTAQQIALAIGAPLTGESAITNLEMFDVALGMGFRKERARVTWRPR